MPTRHVLFIGWILILLYQLRSIQGHYRASLCLSGIGLSWYKSLGHNWRLYPSIQVDFTKCLYPSKHIDIVWIALLVYPSRVVDFKAL